MDSGFFLPSFNCFYCLLKDNLSSLIQSNDWYCYWLVVILKQHIFECSLFTLFFWQFWFILKSDFDFLNQKFLLLVSVRSFKIYCILLTISNQVFFRNWMSSKSQSQREKKKNSITRFAFPFKQILFLLLIDVLEMVFLN